MLVRALQRRGGDRNGVSLLHALVHRLRVPVERVVRRKVQIVVIELNNNLLAGLVKLVYDSRCALVKGHLENVDVSFGPLSEGGVDPAVRQLTSNEWSCASVISVESHWRSAR